MLTVLLRADGGPTIGIGHVMRCLALAEGVNERGGIAHFACAGLPHSLFDRLAEAGFAVHCLKAAPGSADDLAETLGIAERIGAGALVLDGYHFDEGWRAGFQSAGLPVLAFDDLGDLPALHADIVLNAAPQADALPYGRIAPGARLLLGPAYALMRREFREAARAPGLPLAERRGLLLTFGGSDPLGLTAPLVRWLAPRLPDDCRLIVVVGGQSLGIEQARQLAELLPDRLELHVDCRSMASLMGQAGLSVAAAGTTSGELAALGVPSILIIVADNQVPAAKASADLGWCAVMDGRGDGAVPLIGAKVLDLWRKPALRTVMAGRAVGLVDTEGAVRAADALLAFGTETIPFGKP